MKKSIIFLLMVFTTLSAVNAQTGFADLFVNVTINPSIVRANGMAILDIDAGNGGNDSLVANSVRLTVTVGVNAEILSLAAGTDPRWTLTNLTTGFGNTAQLRNTGGQFEAFDAPKVFLNVRGFSTEDGIDRIMDARVSFNSGSYPGGPGGALRLFAAQGNTDPNNDNGSTSFIVDAVLPIKLNDVAAATSGCSSIIKWSTSLEDPTTTFDVEYSAEGRSFVNVAAIKGKGNTSGGSYDFTYNQGDGKGFYRIKMIGANGSISYSKVVNTLVNCNAKKVFIYPNPIRNQQNLNINISGFNGKITGELFAADTKLMLSKQLINGLNTVTINNLAQGNYMFKVTDEKGESKNYKIVVVK